MRAMWLRSLILAIWSKVQPVPDPPPAPQRQTIYALENACFNHRNPIALEYTAPGVWICPECRKQAYVQTIRTQTAVPRMPVVQSPLRHSRLTDMINGIPGPESLISREADHQTIVMHKADPVQEDAWLSDDEVTTKRPAVKRKAG